MEKKRRTRAELEKEIEQLEGTISIHKKVIQDKNAKYNSSVDRIGITIPKGRKKDIATAAEISGYSSINQYVSTIVLADVDRVLSENND